MEIPNPYFSGLGHLINLSALQKEPTGMITAPSEVFKVVELLMKKNYRGDLVTLHREFNELINHLMQTSQLDYSQASRMLFSPLGNTGGQSLSELIRSGNSERAWKIVTEFLYRRRQERMQKKKFGKEEEL